MFEINNTIVSRDIFTQLFNCDLSKCHGECCVQGESGAPLEEDETKLLGKLLPSIAPFMRKEAVDSVKQQGVFVIDTDGEYVTPLLDGKECVYTIFDKGIARCAIEMAFLKKKISFRKPLSCHLYPIRIGKLKDMEAVNYHRWTVCAPAISNGREKKTVLFDFLKEPLIRKFGKKWFDDLTTAFAQYISENTGKTI